MYFPVNDHVVHRKGPMTTEGIEEIDKEFTRNIKCLSKLE